MPNRAHIPNGLVAPGIRDARQVAFAALVDEVIGGIAIKRFFLRDAFTVDARLLPALVVQYSLGEFVEPGLSEIAVRRLVDRVWDLHEMQGYVAGVRYGLDALGATMTWVHWWQEEPFAHHDTHKVSVFFGEVLFAGAALGDARYRSAAGRVIKAMKRKSQDISVRFGVYRTATRFVGTRVVEGSRYVAALPGDDPTIHPTQIFTASAPLVGGRWQAMLEAA